MTFVRSLALSFVFTSGLIAHAQADFQCISEGDYEGEHLILRAELKQTTLDISAETPTETESLTMQLPFLGTFPNTDPTLYPILIQAMMNDFPSGDQITVFDPLTAVEAAVVDHLNVLNETEFLSANPLEDLGEIFFVEAIDALGNVLGRFAVIADTPLLGRCQ